MKVLQWSFVRVYLRHFTHKFRDTLSFYWRDPTFEEIFSIFMLTWISILAAVGYTFLVDIGERASFFPHGIVDGHTKSCVWNTIFLEGPTYKGNI